MDKFERRIADLRRQVGKDRRHMLSLKSTIATFERALSELAVVIEGEEAKTKISDPADIRYSLCAQLARTRQVNSQASLETLRPRLADAEATLAASADKLEVALRAQKRGVRHPHAA